VGKNILVISGPKQSGKTSLASFVHGYVMRDKGICNAFDIDTDGNLLVNVTQSDASGNDVDAMGILDITRRDWEFSRYADSNIWPHVKLFNFANNLKDTLMIVFGLTQEQLYGTNEQKNETTHVTWDSFFDVTGMQDNELIDDFEIYQSSTNKKYLTGRQLMQLFGTDICRKLYDNCWVESCYRNIEAHECELAIIADARYPNEIDFMKSKGAKSVRLTRRPYGEDTHISETALDDYDSFDLVIDNKDMDIVTKNQTLLNNLYKWGWVGGRV
jgi:hypothetical protein